MLTGLLGIRLFLWMGSPIPTPPPVALLNAVTQVRVTDSADSEDVFEITFSVSKDTPIEYGPFTSGSVSILNRVLIGVIFGVTPETILDGVITKYSFSPSNEPGKSTLTVTGSDISLLFDLEDANYQYDGRPDSVIFAQIIAQRYARYLIVPKPTLTTVVPLPIQYTPSQAETDRAYIQRLAERNGFVFYIQPPSIRFPALVMPTTAYFGPENRLDIPQPALAVNMGPATNVNTLTFAMDGLAPVSRPGAVLEPITKTIIPIPALPPINLPPLALMPVLPNRTERRRGSAKETITQAIAAAKAAATSDPDPLEGKGELDGLRYGHALRAGGIVGVQGAGFNHDGLYKVKEVIHTIAPGSYSQQFTLTREGTGSITPAV
jgi:hypothetical protein